VFRAGVFFLLTAGVALCGPVTWTLSSAVFNDGGTLSGTFVFDADTGTVSNWNLATTTGSTLTGFTYTPASSTSSFTAAGSAVQCPAGNCIYFNNNGNTRYLILGFAPALTDGGGTANLDLDGANSGASYECLNCGTYRYLTSGSVTAPLPQTLSFDTIPNQIFGVAPFSIAAQASSQLPVSFVSTTPAVCTTASGLAMLLSAGTCTITANQAGNAGFQPAPSVTRSFKISQAIPSGTLTAGAGIPVGTAPNSVAVGDFNGDGIPDLAVANYTSDDVTVLLGQNSGGFAAAPGSPFPAALGGNPYSVAVGDFNGDGNQDLAIAAVTSDNVTVLLGDGRGDFAEAPGSPFGVGLQPFFVAVGDFNGDGIPDLAVANAAGNSVTVLVANGSGGFTEPRGSPYATGTTPESVAVGDFNGDGNPDLAVANVNSNNVTVLLGNGLGGFEPAPGSPFPVGTNPFSVAAGDFNGDGIADIAAANQGDSTVTVLLGSASGVFTKPTGSPFAAGEAPFSMAVGDFNGDGIQDLAMANGSVRVLLGNGAGGFALAPGTFAAGNPIAVGDFNRDGIEDLAAVNSGGNTVTVLLGALTPTSSLLSTISPLTITVGQPVPLSDAVSDTGTAFNPITGNTTFVDGAIVLGLGSQTGTTYTFTATGLAVGSHPLQAVYGGGSGNAGSTSNTITILVLGTQTITFGPLSNVNFGVAPFGIGATASSGLPVSFASNSPAVCTVNVATMTITGVGTCSITASQAGNGTTYAAAPPVTQTFTVSVGSETITFDTIPDQLLGVSPFAIAAQSSSLLPVAINSLTTAICKTADDLVTLLGAGTCTIQASQAGNVDYTGATPVTRSFHVGLAKPTGTLIPATGSPIATGTRPNSVAIGDFNGDGKADFAIADSGDNTVTVLIGDGAGGFSAGSGMPIPVGLRPESLAVGDFNGDGKQDLAVANASGGNVTVLLGNGLGGFAPVNGSPFTVGTTPLAIAVGDFNADGIQDLAIANSSGGNVTVLLGNGSGGFAAVSGSPFAVGTTPTSITVGDFNGDGAQDLAVANQGDSTVTVLLGNGLGGFAAAKGSPFSVGTGPFSVAVGDFNLDGKADLATANFNGNTETVLLGDGAGGFAEVSGSPFAVGSSPYSVAVGDFNGDGKPDLFTANFNSNNVTILVGDGAGGFTAATGSPFGAGTNPVSLVVGDFNGDGIQDLATANNGSNDITVRLGVPPLTITLSPNSISTITGGSVSASFSAIGGSGVYTFAASGLPAGVTLGAGSLGGSPTQAGTYAVTVTVTDTNQSMASASTTINVLGLTTTALPGGTAGQFYGTTMGAAGGTGAYLFSAAGLPMGLSITNYGYLSGTVTTAGTYPLSVTVSSGGLSVSGNFTLTIAQPQPLSISGASLPSGMVNVPYSQALSASGGVSPYTWSVIAGGALMQQGLPPGLSMNASGIVGGTPSSPGSFSFAVQVTDTAGATATAAVSLTVQPAPLTITTQTLPAGMSGVDYPQQQLSVIGGVSPFTWAVASGSSLPPGMTLSSSGVLNGVPGAPGTASARGAAAAHASSAGTGTFPVGVTVTDHANTQSGVTIPLTIRPPGADLILTAGSLAFSLSSPAASPPASQVVGVQSTQPSQPIAYTVAVSPAAPWLSLVNGTTTPDSIQVSITSAALTLSPAAYQATITATCTSSSCNGNTQTVSVTLTVTAAPPDLRISTTLVSFATTNAVTGSLSQPINLENSGGGSLGFASIACEAAWCTAGPIPSSLAGGVSTAIPVTVNPGLLSPGFYRTQVDIATSGGKGAVPVTLFISANATMTLAPSGAQFNMPAGSGPGNPSGSFLVSVNSLTAVNWNAAIVSIPGIPVPSWLVLGTTSGSSSSTQPGTVSFSINPFAGAPLVPGAYYGTVEVSSPDVSNSPEDFEVVLNVTAANAPVSPDPEPGGLLFITPVGGVLPPQTVTVYSGSPSPLTFQASAATTTGSGWLSVTPDTGSASTNFPGVTTVNVNTAKLSAGVYQGGVSYSLSATAVRTVNVTLIVSSTGGTAPSATSTKSSPRDSGCAPSVLVPAQTGLVSSFSQPAGWPTPLAIVLSNDCGSAVSNGQVVATFSNGDPPLALPLVDPAQGLYTGTWAPVRSSSQVSIEITANAPGYPTAVNQIAGAVVPNAVPVLSPNGTLHSFDPLVGGALAPGTIVAIYGQNLAAAAAQPTTIPLPTTFNGTSVVVGGLEAPIYYVSPGQINAQIPFELQSGNQYDVYVSADGALTNSQPVQLAPATPGLAAFSNGTLIAQHSDGSLVSATSPATAGEYLVAYLAGLGETNVPVSSGTASPASPLAQPSDAPVLTINGAQFPIAFAGLTPGLVGLYQMNFQAPTGLPAGNVTVVVSQNGQASNQTVLPYQP
jgi:uncharacterized protein (TIGR03437 family)